MDGKVEKPRKAVPRMADLQREESGPAYRVAYVCECGRKRPAVAEVEPEVLARLRCVGCGEKGKVVLVRLRLVHGQRKDGLG